MNKGRLINEEGFKKAAGFVNFKVTITDNDGVVHTIKGPSFPLHEDNMWHQRMMEKPEQTVERLKIEVTGVYVEKEENTKVDW